MEHIGFSVRDSWLRQATAEECSAKYCMMVWWPGYKAGRQVGSVVQPGYQSAEFQI